MANDVDTVLTALGDPTRRRIVELLHERPHAAGELVAAFEASAHSVRGHLRVLRRSGLVAEHRPDEDTRTRIYRLRPEPFITLQAWLSQVQTPGAGQLGQGSCKA